MTLRLCLLALAFPLGIGPALAVGIDPNEAFRLQFSRKLIDNLFKMPIENERPITQKIKDTVVKGTALTKGDLKLELVPSATNGILLIRVDAETNSHSVAKNVPRKDITIHIKSRVQTTLYAEKAIIVYPDRIVMREAEARATSVLTYEGLNIDATGAFRNIKEKKAHELAVIRLQQEKSKRETEASALAASEMKKILDERITMEMFRSINTMLRRDFYRPLFESGRIPGAFHLATRTGSVAMCVDSKTDLSDEARAARPEFSPNSVVSLRMHESLLTAILEKRLAGRSMDEEDLEEFLIMHGIPAGLAHYAPGAEQLRMKFGEKNPIALSFDDDEVRLTLQSESAAFASRSQGSLRASVRYHLGASEDGRLVFERREIEATQDPELQRRFARLFPARLSMDELSLPEAMSSAGELRVEKVSTKSGWLSAEWRIVK